MRLTVAVTGLAVCIAGALAQANFGDSSSSSGSESADQVSLTLFLESLKFSDKFSSMKGLSEPVLNL